MGPYFSRETFRFLQDLKKHNERAWFTENKARYEEHVKEPALRLIEAFAPRLDKLSPHFLATPRSLFRIHRDTRFAKDKSPYKTHVGLHFRHERSRDAHAPGYYLHIEPGGVFAGLGIWHPDAPALGAIRQYIADEQSGWLDQLQRELLRLKDTIKIDPTWVTRYGLHLNNIWVDMHNYQDVHLQENNLKETYCLDNDLTFQAWMKIHLPKILIKTVSLSEGRSKITDQKNNRAQSKALNQNTISYVGPISDRFGFDIFLQFILFLQESGLKNYTVEICTNINAKEIIESNKAYHWELVKVRFPIVFMNAPTGMIFFFNRHEYPVEQNWKIFYLSKNFLILEQKEFSELKNELENHETEASAQDLT